MKEHMKITVETFVTLIGIFYTVTTVMMFIVIYQGTRLSKRPAPVPVTTVEIDGETYKGQIWSDGNVYAVLNDNILLFVADNQGAMLGLTEDWMPLSKKTRAEVKHIVVDDSIESIDAYAMGTASFKNLEAVTIQGHMTEVGAYSMAWLPQDAAIEFRGGVDSFGINALHDHNPETISGTDPGQDALHYYPFK